MHYIVKRIVFIISFCSCFSTHAQLRLNQISGINGLSQNTVKSIIQDSNGFIWIGTYNGINKYDGYSMVHYNFSDDYNGLSSNIIISLFEDKDGFIWAGTTDAGLNRIDPRTGKVIVYFDNPSKADYATEIEQIFQSVSGVFFIKTTKGTKFFKVSSEGKLLFEKDITRSNKYNFSLDNCFTSITRKHWFYTPNAKIKLHLAAINEHSKAVDIKIQDTNIKGFPFTNGYAINFIEYPKNTIWVVSSDLELFKIKLNNKLQVIDSQLIKMKSGNAGLSNKSYSKLLIAIDKDHRLWFAGDGVLLNYESESGKINYINSNHRKEIAVQQAQQLIIDNSNILWLGTLNDGLYKMDLENNAFLNSNEFFNTSKNLFPAFHQYPILSMCEDDRGYIWLGGQGNGGIAILNKKDIEKSFYDSSYKVWDYNYLTTSNNQFNNEFFYEIKRLMKDRAGNIWAGTKTGLSKISYRKKSEGFDVKKFDDLKDINGNLIKNPVFAIEEDKTGAIWAGYWKNGIVKISFNKQDETYTAINFINELKNPKSLSSNSVRDILEDSKNNIWVGTMRGLNKLVKDGHGKTSFTRYLNEPNNNNSLSNNYVLDIFQASNGLFICRNFWWWA